MDSKPRAALTVLRYRRERAPIPAPWHRPIGVFSVSNHGGDNLDGTPAPIRMLKPIADAVGGDLGPSLPVV
jgi:hypothetical protein